MMTGYLVSYFLFVFGTTSLFVLLAHKEGAV